MAPLVPCWYIGSTTQNKLDATLAQLAFDFGNFVAGHLSSEDSLNVTYINGYDDYSNLVIRKLGSEFVFQMPTGLDVTGDVTLSLLSTNYLLSLY